MQPGAVREGLTGDYAPESQQSHGARAHVCLTCSMGPTECAQVTASFFLICILLGLPGWLTCASSLGECLAG